MTFDHISRKFGAPPAPKPADKPTLWWCEDCGEHVTGDSVTFTGLHDERYGGCGCRVEPYCAKCENGGWMQVYSPNPPCFNVCDECFNPFDRPSP